MRLTTSPKRGDRGMLHGLSLLAITLALFGLLAFFALARFPLRCACKDQSFQDLKRNGFDSPKDLCEQACAHHGGGAPVTRKAK